MKNRRSPSGLRLVVGFGAAIVLSLSFALVHVAAQSGQGLPVPIPGKNVNMVSGTTLPGGDPFLQRQNEPSISVSTRNPLHLFGASNDYRTVDIPGLGEEVTGDAWIGIFKSFDGGATWKSSLLPGFRQDVSPDGIASPLHGLEAAADPVIRAGTNGMFYMGGMAFDRDQDDGKVFVARYIDNNNREAGDSISYIGTTVIDTGNETRFLDKPWIAVDIPRDMKGNGKPDKNDHRKDDKDKNKDKYGRVNDKDDKTRKPTTGPVCQIPGQPQPIPAGTIYVMYSAFLDPVGGSANLPPRADRAEEERERGENEQHKRRERENGEDHVPGKPMEGRTLIMLSRSTDCGRTFSRPQKISERTQINQGSVAAIDPNSGTIYVAWREFMSNAQPDAILVTKSTDGGDSFSSPVKVALIHPFDQASSATKFRTNSYPTMTVDATGRVYVAWAERGIGPIINGQGGDARIVIATSTDGKKWSTPTPAENPQQRGHQFMPVLSFGGGRLHLVWWDQRDDRSKMWGTFIDEAPILNWVGAPADRPSRHTIDLRGAQGLPGAAPQFGPSVRVSNYLEGVRAGKTEPEQLQFNAPNLPLFALGTTPFIGDYLDVSMSPAFIANGDGTWRYNTLASDPSLFFTSWSDNRDVRKPADGNWAHYTPPTFAGYTGTSIFDPTQPVEVCSQGQAGMRDQNVYSSRVQSGLVITTLGNTKPLGFVTAIDGTRQLIQRTFVVTVSNPDPPVRQANGTITGYKDIVLHINAQPVGGRASFLQFEPLIDLPVRIAPRSSISRDVFVTSTDRNASVPVTVTEGTSTATSAKLIINPDITNPDIENPDIENPDIENPDITNAEAHAITVSNPDITNPDIENLAKANPDIENPDIENPDIENPDIENPDITNPDIINPDIENPDIENPDIENPDIENPDIENPDIENAALTDVTWNVSNVGNTATSYQVKLLLKQAQQQRLVNAGVKFQLVVTKNTASPVLAKDLCAVESPNRNLTVVTINSPTFIDPQDSQAFSTIVNPDIENPDIENATLALAPGDTARVTLRVYSPVGDTTTDPTPDPTVENPLTELTGALEDLKNLGVVTTSHPVDTIAVQQGSTTPVVTASIPIIVTTTLPDATRTVAYTAALVQTGSTPPFSFSLTTGALPPGLTLQPDGHVVGTPLASGVYTFTVRLTDSTEQEATATLSIRVFEPIVIAGGILSGAVVNQSFSTSLSASGGFSPFAWSVTGGALPTGATLSPSGVIAGTPTQSGTFTFTAQAMDVADPSQAAAAALVLNVTPTANPQTVTAPEDTATTITVSGTGAAQGAFTFAIGNQPAHGTLTGAGPAFSYTPASNYTGPDSFTFRVTQGSLTSAFATVTINVTSTNDAPVATAQTVNTPQGVARAITLTGSDAENSALTFAIVTGPTSGTLTGTAPNVTYTPTAGFTGTATFTFRVNDGTVNSTPATVSVIVGPPPAGSADVTLALVDVPDPANIGANITYTATLHNNGPATANTVTFTLSYPAADLQFVSATPTQGTCGTANPIVCTIGAIANGGNVSIPIVLRAFNRGGTFAVTSSAAIGAQLDYNTSNNIASQATLVNGPATPSTDLHVQQTSAPNPVVFGGNTVYTIVVVNNGPSDATGVSLTNTFTAATAQFVSATASQGSCSPGGNQVSCNVGGLVAGAFATYTMTLRANGGGTLSNTAVVTGSQADANAADNSSTLATTISNRAPTANNDVATVNEDAPATTIFALSNDTDADGDTLTITGVTPGENTHGTVQVVGTNALSYAPASNYNGPASFSYAISDGHGGTANATVNVTVLAVNDAPSFVAGPNQSTGENSGPQTVPGWATAISAGPAAANEGAQTVSFIVANNNHSLFSSQPAVSPAGTLTYTAAASGSGTATVTVTAQDNGGTDNGGVDSSASQTFTITIGSTNDAPSFTAGPSQTIPEDAPLQTVPNWATNISAGPPDESGQLIDFIVINDNNALFTTQPSVSPTGTLTYQPAANAFGSATVTVRVHDNGGTTPGVDTSAPQTFLITVTQAAGAATFVAINTNDAGPGSLRQAIIDSNLNAGFTNTIRFQIGTGPVTISPLTSLPTITVPVVIDGSTQPGFTGVPLVELDGTNTPSGNGLTFTTGNSTIRSLIVNRFKAAGIVVSSANGNLIVGNYIGLNASGTAALGNLGAGLNIVGSNNTIGGTAAADRNVISGNAGNGVLISIGSGNQVLGNFIGTDASGTQRVANGGFGVSITSASGNTVGGTAPGARNVISGNTTVGVGLSFTDPIGNVVQGNYIGTDVTGTVALGNGAFGVQIATASHNLIGGTTAAARNVISGNAFGGIGMFVGSSTANTIQGNYIGTTVSGNAALPNLGPGVSLSRAAAATGPSGNTIGGAVAGAGNVISANTGSGITIADSATGNVVQGNFVGVGAGAGAPLGNTQDGITITAAAFGNTIGGAAPGAANVFAFNGGNGVNVVSGAGNAIRTNAIFSNTRSGIDLGSDNATANDAGDADSGANNLQNYPVLTLASTIGSTTTVVGTLNSTPNGSFSVDLFSIAALDPSGFGEGQSYLGSVAVTTDGAGNGSFSVTLPVALPVGSFITSTATDAAGNTSEFSLGLVVTATFVNHAPSFTRGADQTTLEDGGLQNAAQWATNISPGDPSEAGQVLTFAVSNNNTGLFQVQPSIDASGTLRYQAAPNAFGSALVTVTLSDNGGTANGGVDTSAPQTFTITVTPVNDPPGFHQTSGLYQVADNVGSQTVPGWIDGITAGPANEASQTVTFVVTNDNNALFSAQPAVSPTGTLTFTPSAIAGTATVTVVLHDDGGVANGGVDASAPQTFTITVSTNHAPVANGQSVATLEDVPLPITLTATDTDNDPLSYSIVAPPANGLLSGALPNVTYTPFGNYNGPDAFSFQVSDRPAINLITGLVSRWPFDGTALDVAGGNNPSATAGLSFVAGKSDRAVTLGAGGFIDVADAPSLRLQALTVSAWVRPQGPNTTPDQFGDNIISKWTLNGGAAGSVALTWRASDGRFVLVIGSATPTVISTDGFAAGSFYHVAATYDGAVARLFVNGQPQGQTPLVTVIPYDAQRWVIGSSAFRGSSFDRKWNGAIDDLRIYSRALSSAELGVLASEAVSNAATVAIAVTPVNDPPQFSLGSGLYVAPFNGGAQTVPAWVTGISAGPANEASQQVTFLVTNDNATAFAVQPAISPTGTLTFTLASGETSQTTVTVRAQDNGGVLNSGSDTSLPQTFIIAVATPTSADLDVSIADSQDPVAPGAQYSYSATIHNAGPGNATGVLFTINTSPNVTVHAISGPGVCEQTGANQYTCGTGAIASGGSVLYGIATSASLGTATVTGSVSSSTTDPNAANNSAQESTVINRPPTGVPDNATTASAVAVDVNVLANDSDPDTSLGDVLHIASIGGAQHGIVSTSTGSPIVRYTPEPGFTGIDTFNYTVADTAGSTSALTTVTVLVTQAVCAAEPSGLISWWPGSLDVTATDIRGGNDGTPQGTVSTAPGIVGNAFSFNRTPGSGILVPNAANLNPSQITLAAWVRPAATVEDYQSIIRKTGSYALGLSNNAYAVCEIGSVFLPGGSVPAGQWSHVVCTYDGTTVQLYVNGAQVTSIPYAQGIPLNTVALMIGGDALSGSNGFNGLIDEAQVFGRALPIEDILSIVNTGDAGLCTDQSAVVTDDTITVTSDGAVTLNPSANDRDPDVPFPSVLATVRGLAPGTPQFWTPGEIGVVQSTGLAYFGSSLVAPAAPGAIGILDTNTNTVVGSMSIPVPSAQTQVRVNQTTNIVYFRGTTLNAVDGRAGSPTFNQVILSLALGNIQSMALDETRGRLYLTSSTSATAGSLFNSRFIVLDVNPLSATFHQVVDQIIAPGGGTGLSVAVNTVTNKVYVAVSGGTQSGVYALDVATNTWTLISLTTNPSTLVVNDANNLVYAVSGTSLYVIDGATNTRIALITLPASGSIGAIDTRLAVYKALGRVYVRLSEFPAASRLAVIDGNRASPTFNTILTTLAIGREDGQTMLVVDEANNRVIATSRSDLRTTVINATTNAIVGTVQSTQPSQRVFLDAAHHRAYVIGGVTTIRSIDVTTGAIQAVLQVASELSPLAVNTVTHTAYVPQTTTGTGVALVNQTGSAGNITLPHVDGRETFAVRNRVTNRIYALNSSAAAAGASDALPGFVHVIDGNSNAVIASVPVGAYPFAIGLNELTNKIYVGNSFSGTSFSGGITVIDGATNGVVQANMSQIPTTSTTPGQISVARDMVVNTATGNVYFRVTGGSNVTLGVLDGTTNVASPIADDNEVINIVRVNPVLNRVYVAAQETLSDPSVVYILDGATHDLLGALQVGSPTPFVGTQSHLAVNVTTGRVFVADYDHDTVSVIDPSSNTVTATIAVGDGPSTVAVNETLNRIYVGNALDKTLTIIDGNTLRVAATLSLPLAPVRLDVDESVSQIFAGASLIDPGVMVINDPGTTAPAIAGVTNGGAGTVVLNADGSVTYTPSAGYIGDDTFTYTIPDGLGGFRTGTVHVTVAAPLNITSTGSLPSTAVGQAYPNLGLTALAGTAPYAWSVASGQLPPGIALTATGTIYGMAVQSGTFAFTLQARDSSNPPRTATKIFTIIVAPPVIVTSTLPSAFVNTLYNAQVVAGGATTALTWTINTNNNPLLSWLSISNAGVLTGTPPTVGSMPSFTVTATDATNQSASRSLTLFVSGPLDIEPLREGVILEAEPAMSIIGGRGNRTVSVTSGALPPGLVLLSSGSFTGTPTRHGTFNFTVELRDCANNTCFSDETPEVVSKNLALRVSAKDQVGSSQTQPAISFGGAGGRRMAQVVTVGANGSLTGIGLQNITCPQITPLTVDIQRLTLAGLPDGTTIATGTATTNYNAISTSPPVNMSIDEKFAFIVSSPVACTFVNAATTDQYNGGDAYVDAGGGWVSLLGTDGRYDIPSFRTLLQPAMPVGYFTNARSGGATATRLNNGTVLLAGTGVSAEIYDPVANSSTFVGNMTSQRTQHTATLLQDGTVLIVGGQTGGVRLATAETYNPATGLFTATANSMSVGRDLHAATRLNDGRVLITGGNITNGSSSLAVASTEIYDPVTRTFAAGPSMTTARQVHNSTLLASGKVLVASGFISGVNGATSRSAEIYDPVANTFTATTGQMSLARGRSAAELLADGRVLIAGGQSGPIRNTAEIYDPSTDSFTAAGSMATPRYLHSMTRLADGSVLVAGGFDENTVASYVLPLATMERYLPASNTFVPAGATEARRAQHTAITLDNGTVLLVGGAGQSFMSSNTVEFYSLATSPALASTLPDGQTGVAYPSTTLTASGGSGGPYQIQLVAGTLPPGLNYDQPTATISGTPGADGLYVLGFRVTDSQNHTSAQPLSIRIGAPFVITTPYQLVSGALTHIYDVPLASSGGTAPVVWSLAPASGAPPAGLAVDATGRIIGTPTTGGGTTFGVRAVDAIGRTAQKTFNINIQTPLDISTTILPEAAIKESYTFCMSSVSGITANNWSVVGGTMPPGVILQTNGCFNNPPNALGTFTPQIQVTDLASPPEIVTRTFTIRVSAKDQEGGSQTQPVISFGGAGGRRLAQTVTVGANGTLTAFGFNSSTTCQAPIGTTIDVQRLGANGMPDGTTIATGSTTGSLSGVALSPLSVSVGDRLAFILSSTGVCTIANVPATNDSYQAGDGLSNSGGGWVSLLNSDGRYDIPFRTMIQPATEVTFMNRSRNSFEATVLNNGRVLLTSNGNPADLYDPATRTMTPTGNMIAPRSNHTATLLADGTVLLAGGRDLTGVQLTTAEIYDPVAGTFTQTAGSMSVPHEAGTATRLNDGRVFIAGGRTFVGAQTLSIPTTEIYDPVSRTFTFAGNMLTDRHYHTATLLASGKVLLIAGFTGGISGSVTRSAETYDPTTGIFTATAGSMSAVRGVAASARLADGRVLVTGGQSGDLLNTAEIYDPATDSFSPTGSMSSRRYTHTATTLADGSVLIAGGLDEVNASSYILPVASMERYIPASGTFVPAGGMETRRAYQAAARLQDGRVLLAGGSSQSWMSGNTAELYDPAVSLSLSPSTLADAQPGVAYTPVTLSASGGIGPYQISLTAGALPPGMAYNSQTFVLSGTLAANVVGSFSLGFLVADSASHFNMQSLALHVGALNTITNPYRLTDATLGLPYSLQLTATGPGPITWLNGPPSSLPPGLVLSTSGVISGTPTTQAFYNFAVRAMDAQGRLAIKTLSINVIAPMTITTTSLQDGLAANGSYGGCVNRSNGVNPVTFTLSGQIPAGMVLLSNGCFDGTFPAQALREGGTFTFTVTATDSSPTPQVVSRNYTIRVHTDDEWPSAQSTPNVPLPSTRRIAQVFTTGTPYGLSGASLFNIQSCTPGTQMTVNAYPIIGSPARPDESSGPLASAVVTVSANGSFGNRLYFATTLAMPQHSPIAIVASFAAGSCQGVGWPTADWYPQGSGWIDDGSGWQPSATVIGRPDVLLTTITVPGAGLRFTPFYRSNSATTVLGNGRVLLVGGDNPAETFDPVTQTIAPTTGAMLQTRNETTATLMPNGNVLIVGGSHFDGTHTVTPATTEIYNPTTGAFSAGAPLPFGRATHRATLLANGRVLITGGWTIDGSFNTVGVPNAWLLDAGGNLIATIAMAGSRNFHSATRLADGRVLIAGGWGLSPTFVGVSAEIYDPAVGANGTFTSLASSMVTWSGQHTATLLTTGPRAGQVLIAGGGASYPALRQASEFFNPSTLTFSAGPILLEPRIDQSATILADGRIVFAGGQTDWSNNQFATSIEIYDPVTNTFSSAGDMRVDRSRHDGDLISGGRVMFGPGNATSLIAPRSVELFDPANLGFRITTAKLPDGITNQAYSATTLQVTGGSGTGNSFSLAQGSLPPGMSLNQNGTISGAPTAGGRYDFSVTVTDSASNVASRGFTITVNRVTITSTSSLPNGTVGGNYNFQFVASGTGTISWSLEPGNTLPPNLTLSASGLLSGPTPSAGGFFFNLRATDSTGQSTVKGFSLQVQ